MMQDFLTVLRPASFGSAAVLSFIILINQPYGNYLLPLWAGVAVFSLVLNVGMIWANRGRA